MKFFKALGKILTFTRDLIISCLAFILVIPLALIVFAIYIGCAVCQKG